jgi:probable metal-binding protein
MIDSNSIKDQIHGHEVMKMMVESGEAFTRASLQAAILTRFGTDARFYTCSAKDMTTAALIDFLEQRGKFVPKDNGFSTLPDKICCH